MLRSMTLGALLALVAVSGCNKVIWGTSSATPAGPKEPELAAGDPEPVETMVVKGALREALLSLQRVHFPYNSASLLPASRQALAEAAQILGRFDDVRLSVEGHCDVRGSEMRNRRLGEERAAAVAKFLATSGVRADRLEISSFGKQRILASGIGVRDHALNRRVEYRLKRGNVRLVLEEGVLLDDVGQPLTKERSREAGTPPDVTDRSLSVK